MDKQTFISGQRIMIALTALALLLWAGVGSAHAAEGLELSTTYPGMTVNAGDELSYSIDIYNGTGAGMTLTLDTASMPQDWEGYFKGDSTEISEVYVKSGDNDAVVTFTLTIPDTQESGDYEVVLRAAGEGIESTLTLNLKVAAEEIGSSRFEAQYPEQEGTASASFSYDTTLVNSSATTQNYSFSTSAPTGWTVSYTPSGESDAVNSISLEPRQSQTITVAVQPATDAEAGDYTISCSATSSSETLQTELTATITGNYELDLSTPTGRLSTDATVGTQKEIALTITNNGNTELTNVNLSAYSSPDDWTVSFSESTIDTIEPGASVEVTAYVTPSDDAISGDYVLTLKASNSDASDTAEFRISVETQTIWGVVAVLLIAAVALALYAVFRKYGRR